MPVLLGMERKFFSAERELRALFASLSGGHLGAAEEEKEQPNAEADMYADQMGNASKNQRRRLKMMQKQSKNE